MIPYLRTENLKNHTLSRGTYLYSPYMGVPTPPPPPGSPQHSQRALRKQIIQFIVNVSLTAFCRRYGKSSSTLRWCKSTLYDEVREQK